MRCSLLLFLVYMCVPAFAASNHGLGVGVNMVVGTRSGPAPAIVSTLPVDGSTIFTNKPTIQFVFNIDMNTTRTDATQVLLPSGLTVSQLVWADSKTLNILYTGALDSYGAKRVELFDNYFVSTGNMPVPKGAGLAFNFANTPPAFVATAQPSMRPNPASTNDIVTYSCAATDTNGDTLTFTWNFGDGTVGSGATTTHQYAAAGVYLVIITVTDGNGGVLTQPLLMTVTQGAAATPPTVLPWKVTRTIIRLGFRRPGRDTIQVQGTATLPAGFDPTNKAVTVSVGAVNASFTMDKHGNGKTGTNHFRLIEKLKKKQFLGGDVKIMFTLKGAFASALSASGLVNATTPVKGTPITIADGMTIAGVPSANGPIIQAYLTNVTATYKAKQGVTGNARSVKK